ncbi:MAG: DUF1802 family protein [Acidimicrobiia bacterium]
MEPTAAPTLALPGPVVRALLAGECVADLRLPGTGGPPAGHRRFWLLPSGDEPDLKAAYRRARELSLPEEPPPAGQVRIEGWAELVGRAGTGLDAERVAALNSKTVLDLDALAGAAGGAEVTVLALRVHRLVEARTVPEDLSGLPADPSGEASEWALSDVAFEARLKGLVDALPQGLSPA